MKKVMVFFLLLPVVCWCLASSPVLAAGGSEELLSQLQALKAKLEELEKKVAEQDRMLAAQEKMVTKHAEEIKKQEEINAGLEDIKEVLGGIEIGADITMIGQGTPDDDEELGYENGTDASFSFDLEVSKSFSWNGLASIVLEGGNGEGIDGRIDSWSGFNDDNDDDENVHVTEAWYEQSLFDGKFTFTGGKIDLTNYFDANEVANDETFQFLSTGFVNNLAVAFPDNGPGVRATVSPGEMLAFSLGWMATDEDSGDSSWNDIGRGSFVIGEVDIKPTFASLPGNYRFFAWYLNANLEEWDGSDDDESAKGFGLSFDQQLLKDVLTVFVRAGWQDEELFAMDAHYSAGLQLTGSYWKRADDVVGLAYGCATISDDYKDFNRDNGDGAIDDDEHHVELYYRWVFNEHLALTADYQWLKNPTGNSDADNVSVFGLRTQVDF